LRNAGDDYDDDSSVDTGEFSEEEGRRNDESNVRITMGNVGPITLTREFFAKYCHYPQFESTIMGCFTRVRVSERDNDYRFTRIEGLVGVSKYSVESVPVDQGLELSQGSSKKVINMDVSSNSSITEVLSTLHC
jgi:RNA polymerase-associated protein RTF1